MNTLLRTFPWKTKIFRFESEFKEHTKRPPVRRNGRLFADAVLLNIRKVNSIEVRLLMIETLPEHMNQGKASEALSWLCEMADAYQLQISLCPVPQYSDTLTLMQLTAWYQKYGFVRLGYDDEMIRYPHAN